MQKRYSFFCLQTALPDKGDPGAGQRVSGRDRRGHCREKQLARRPHFAGSYRLTEENGNWESIDEGVGSNVDDLLASEGTVFAGTWKGIYRSTDNGETWTEINNGLANTSVSSLLLKDDAVFAGTADIGYGVFVSRDRGESWTASNNGLTPNGIREVYSLMMSGSTLFAATDAGPLMHSRDEGKNWSPVEKDPFPTSSMTCLVLMDTTIIAGSMHRGFALSADTGSTWTMSNTGLSSVGYIRSMLVKDGTVFGATQSYGIVRSADTGKTWTYVNTGLSDKNLNTLALHNGILFAGSRDSGVFRSIDNGTTWTAADNGMTKRHVFSFAANGNTLLAGCDGGGVFISPDDGMHWHEAGTGLPDNIILSLALNDSIVYAGTESRSVWRRPLSELMDAVGAKSGRMNGHHPDAVVEIIRSTGGHLSAGIRLFRNDRVSVNLYDLSGRVAASLFEKDLPPGFHRFLWNAGITSAGCYLVEVRAGETVLVKSIPVFR